MRCGPRTSRRSGARQGRPAARTVAPTPCPQAVRTRLISPPHRGEEDVRLDGSSSSFASCELSSPDVVPIAVTICERGITGRQDRGLTGAAQGRRAPERIGGRRQPTRQVGEGQHPGGAARMRWYRDGAGGQASAHGTGRTRRGRRGGQRPGEARQPSPVLAACATTCVRTSAGPPRAGHGERTASRTVSQGDQAPTTKPAIPRPATLAVPSGRGAGVAHRDEARDARLAWPRACRPVPRYRRPRPPPVEATSSTARATAFSRMDRSSSHARPVPQHGGQLHEHPATGCDPDLPRRSSRRREGHPHGQPRQGVAVAPARGEEEHGFNRRKDGSAATVLVGPRAKEQQHAEAEKATALTTSSRRSARAGWSPTAHHEGLLGRWQGSVLSINRAGPQISSHSAGDLAKGLKSAGCRVPQSTFDLQTPNGLGQYRRMILSLYSQRASAGLLLWFFCCRLAPILFRFEMHLADHYVACRENPSSAHAPWSPLTRAKGYPGTIIGSTNPRIPSRARH